MKARIAGLVFFALGTVLLASLFIGLAVGFKDVEVAKLVALMVLCLYGGGMCVKYLAN